MPFEVATVRTAHASSYLRQLCRHWSHRFAVTFTNEHGRIELPQALCTLDAAPELLTVRLDPAPEADATRLRQVVEEHLQRFGFRETLVFQWGTEEQPA